MKLLPYMRELETYPVGLHRAWLLIMATTASLITSFEGQTAPVVPLLLEDLDMSLTVWGVMSASSALAGVISGGLAGPLADRIGRVKLLVPALFLSTTACFCMALAGSTTELFVLRMLQHFAEGFAIATIAPLIRDFTPRVGRAFGLGFFTWGPVGANFLGAALAATTLPLFGNAWESQFVLQGAICFVLSVIITATVRDLTPELRAQIIADRSVAEQVDKVTRPAPDSQPPRALDMVRYPHLWAHCLAISLWLFFYLTITWYGQLILTSEFGMSAADASGVMAAFWVLDLLTLLLIGWLSDRLQLRKPFSLAGTVAATILIFYFASLIGEDVSDLHLMITGSAVGIALAVAYAPWLANYSENAEDVEPRLQGTAFAMYRVSIGTITIVLSLAVPAIVEASGGDWKPWLIVSGLAHAMFIPLMFFFKGPWRRSAAERATQALRHRTLGSLTSERAGIAAEDARLDRTGD